MFTPSLQRSPTPLLRNDKENESSIPPLPRGKNPPLGPPLPPLPHPGPSSKSETKQFRLIMQDIPLGIFC